MRWTLICSLALAGLVGAVLPEEPETPPGHPLLSATPGLEGGVRAWKQGDSARATLELSAWLASGEGPWGRERDAGRFLLGWIHLQEGRNNLASEQFTRVRAGKGPLAPWGAWYEAVSDHRRGRHAVAAGECKAYRKSWPEGPHADSCLILMGDAYVAAGHRQPALEAYQQYLDDNPGTPREEEIRLGMALAEANRSPERGASMLQELTLEHEYLCTAQAAQLELDRIMDLHELDQPLVDPLVADQKRAMSMRDGGFGDAAWDAYQDIQTQYVGDPRTQTWATGTWERFCWRTHRYDELGAAFAGQYARGANAEDAWYAFRAYFRGGDFEESAKWGEIGLAKHGSHHRWRRSRDVVAHANQLAGHYERAREHWDILARTGGSLGRTSEWFAAFCSYRMGEHEDALKRLEPLLARGGEEALTARYYQGKSLAALGRREEAQDTWRVLLDQHPTSWYSLLLRSRWRKLDEAPGPEIRQGRWDGSAPVELTPQVPSPSPRASPSTASVRGGLRSPPDRPVDWSALTWPLQPATAPDLDRPVRVLHPDAEQLPERPDSYIDGQWFDLELQRRTFQDFAQAQAHIWPQLPAALDLASVGIYELSGDIVAEVYDEWQYASGRRTARQKLVRSVSLPKQEWRQIFLYAQDHHHVARFTLGLAPGSISSEERDKAMRLAYPRAHGDRVERWAQSYDVDPLLVLGLMRRESLYRSTALSHAGAVGVMQIMPLTGSRVAFMLGEDHYTPAQLEIPSVNVQYGTYYLSRLLDRFEGAWPMAVAAYNAGPVHVSSWSRSWTDEDIGLDDWVEQIPLRETRTYVKGVSENYAQYVQLYGPDEAQVHVPARLGEDHREVIDF